MNHQSVSVAEAKKHFSDLLGRVAYGKEQITITKRGKPMARLVSIEENNKHLAQAKGWLKEDDPFFQAIDSIVRNRGKHTSRLLKDLKSK